MNTSDDDRLAGQHGVPDLTPSDRLVHESEESLHRSIIKMTVTALVVIGAVLCIHFSPLNQYITDIQSLKKWAAEVGGYGPILFIPPATLLVAAGFPRLILSSIAGAMFGFNIGFLIAWISSGVGSYLNFLFARWGTRVAAQRLLAKTPRLKELINKPGFLSVMLARQLPLWAVAQNMGFATTNIKHRTFLLGTLCGILPTTIILVLIGSGVGKSSLEASMRNLGWAMILLAVLSIGLWQLKKKMSAKAK